MATIDWDDSYSVGVAKLDDQHKALFAMINRAALHAECNGNDATMHQLAADMMAYAFMHFTTEEEFMQSYDYPDLDSHSRMHEDFKVMAMQYEFESQQGTADPIKLTDYLIDWLNGHIRGTDRKLGIYLNKRDIY